MKRNLFVGILAGIVATVAIVLGLARRPASAALVIELPPVIVVVDPTIDAAYEGIHESMQPKMHALQLPGVAE